MKTETVSSTDWLDLRCKCRDCESRTKATYHRSVSCHNCGWHGVAIIRKGDKANTAKDCPHCGCTYTLSFGNDPLLARRSNGGFSYDTKKGKI